MINGPLPKFHGTRDNLDGVVDTYLKPAKFHSILANDLSAKQAAELAATQRPIAASALTEPSGTPPGSASLAGT
jgi:hypothetical protein